MFKLFQQIDVLEYNIIEIRNICKYSYNLTTPILISVSATKYTYCKSNSNFHTWRSRSYDQVLFTENELVPAQTAVEALCHVEDEEVSKVLGFPLITKAEPYKARAEALVEKATSQTNWLIAAVVMAGLLAVLVLLALLFLLHKYKHERYMHSRLLASPGGSSSRSGGSDGSPVDAGTVREQVLYWSIWPTPQSPPVVITTMPRQPPPVLYYIPHFQNQAEVYTNL